MKNMPVAPVHPALTATYLIAKKDTAPGDQEAAQRATESQA
jgi:hypothetical protein